MPKDIQIASLIAAKVAAGMDVRDAYDAVIGAGAFAKLAAELHASLTAKAGA